MAIPHEHPSRVSSPDESEGGFNVKVFLITVFVAAVVIAVILFFAAHKGHKVIPAPTHTTGPNSQATPAPATFRAKPSPLRPAALQASTFPAGTRGCGEPCQDPKHPKP